MKYCSPKGVKRSYREGVKTSIFSQDVSFTNEAEPTFNKSLRVGLACFIEANLARCWRIFLFQAENALLFLIREELRISAPTNGRFQLRPGLTLAKVF